MEEVYKVCKKTKRSIWEISNYGCVKRNGKIYIPNESPQGYLRTSFNSIHRLVAEYFIPNPENKPCIDHINGNKHDNRVTNLRWVTHSENMLNDLTREHNSNSQKIYWNDEIRKQRGEAKRKYFEEHPEYRQKLSDIRKQWLAKHEHPRGMLGKIGERKWICKNNEKPILVRIEDLNQYITNGYHIGRK